MILDRIAQSGNQITLAGQILSCRAYTGLEFRMGRMERNPAGLHFPLQARDPVELYCFRIVPSPFLYTRRDEK